MGVGFERLFLYAREFHNNYCRRALYTVQIYSVIHVFQRLLTQLPMTHGGCSTKQLRKDKK